MAENNKGKKTKTTKKEKEISISKRNVQRLSAESAKLREVVRKIAKTLEGNKIEIKLTKKEREFLALG